MYKISVLLSCYNCEKTLNRAIDSVINQTFGFENIELILYEDGSADKTREIIKDYAKKYDNIMTIFSDINQGIGIGRETCISNVSSDYFMFLDADDAYEKDICETLYNTILKGFDVVKCNHKLFGLDSTLENVTIPKENFVILENEDILYIDDPMLWDKIFKTEIIKKHNIHFKNIRNGEDELFLKNYLYHSKKFIYLKKYEGYRKYEQSDSISQSMSVKDLRDMIDLCEILKLEFEEKKC